jgi:hypothetical protein
MEHLVRRYSPVSGSLVVAAVEGRDSLPRHAVWITFDDGYPDVLEHAEPVLAEFRIPATLFVVAGLVDTDHHLATPLDDPFRMSRVRIDSTANLRRFGAIVSGDHPGAYTAAVVARERLRRTASRSHLSAGVKP